MSKKHDIDIVDTGQWGSMWDSALDSHDPYVDIYRKGDDIVINVQLPDVQKEDIQLRFVNDGIEISARHEVDGPDDMFQYRMFSASFYRFVPLPEGADETGAHAEFDDNILTIRVPLIDAHRPDY